MSDEWYQMGDGDVGRWLISADGTLFIVDSLWVTFEGDGAVGWWVIGDNWWRMMNICFKSERDGRPYWSVMDICWLLMVD